VFALEKRDGGCGGKPGGRGGCLGELARIPHADPFLEWTCFFFLKTRNLGPRALLRGACSKQSVPGEFVVL
jgi:hypothetical protein